MNESPNPSYFSNIRSALELLNAQNSLSAVDLAENLIRSHPDRAEPLYILGLAAAQLGDIGRAADLIGRAHNTDPDCKEYADVLGILYTRIGKLTDGLYFAKLATALEPHPEVPGLIPSTLGDYLMALREVEPSHHFVDALVHFNTRKFRDAIRLCGMALRIESDNAACHALHGRCLFEIGEYARAAEAFHAAIHIDGKNPAYRTQLGECLYHLGRFSAAEECQRMAMAVAPESVEAAAAAALGLRFRESEIWRARSATEAEVAKRLKAHPAVQTSDLMMGAPPMETAKVRIGYIGNRFFDGPDATFFQPLIANHDRSRFEVYCYQQSVTQHSVVMELQMAVYGWREIYDLDPEVVASIVASDGIDVLVDLGGYTLDNPLPVFALKPAPIRVGWLNHLDGSGSETVNLILSDPITEPLDRRALAKGQETLTLHSGLFALRAPALFPEVGELPAKESDGVTFGGYCDLARITPRVASLWAQILKANSRARLLLGGTPIVPKAVSAAAVDLFSHFGVVDRISFYESEFDARVDPGFYASLDVMLDTFPASGTEDVAHALWMGVPVVTLTGDRRTGRYGASIVKSAGKPEWIAKTETDYAAIAGRLVSDLGALAKTRARLRDDLKASNLFRPEVLARSFEAGLVHATGLIKQKAKPEKPKASSGAKKAPAPSAKKTAPKRAQPARKTKPKAKAAAKPARAKAKSRPAQRKKRTR